jgi:hypothetical protein
VKYVRDRSQPAIAYDGSGESDRISELGTELFIEWRIPATQQARSARQMARGDGQKGF